MDARRLKRWLIDLPMHGKHMLMSLTSGGVVIVLLTLMIVGYTWSSSRQALIDGSSAQARVIADSLAPTLMFRNADAAQEVLAGLKFSPHRTVAGVYDLDGRLFQHYGEISLPEMIPPMPFADFQDGVLNLMVPIEIKKVRYGSLLLQVDTSGMIRQMATYAFAVLVAALLALLVGTFVANAMSRFITGRLERLTQTMRNISDNQDFSLRTADGASQDEFGFLARNFDAMLDRIEIYQNSLSLELNERRSAEERLYKLAYSDALTHLPNRTFFNRHLEEKLVEIETLGGSLALMFIDLDNFKSANDNFGHHIGDELLKSASERLSQAVRGSDIVCRLGGDEFAVVIEDFRGAVQVESVAKKMITAMSYPFQIEGHELYIGASIGIALAPEHATEPNDLVRCSDTAMYRAKSGGKSQFVIWYHELGENVSYRYRLEANLRKALERHELEVFFQPVHNIADGSLAGMEALLRWHSSELGAVSPVEFIPIAEESGLIDEMGLWVIDQVCRQLACWRQRHANLYAGVNVSARQFIDPQLPERIVAIIDSHGLPHGCVEIEITESLLLDPSPTTAANLYRLHGYGLPIALDDFGTGYSSLSYLSRFPISKIKIDRSFIMTLGLDNKNTTIVSAIIGMGNNLGMKLQAEGIESAACLEWLGSSGCRLGQGYHYSAPINAEAFARYLEGQTTPHVLNRERRQYVLQRT